MLVIYVLIAIFLLLLNAFFVLAEFAAVKARPTQIEALAEKGSTRAKRVQYIQTHLDRFLSVCQIGITLASIGLGFVGEPAIATIVKPIVHLIGIGNASTITIHGISIFIAYILVSFLHIVIGELVPKSVAIRKTVSSALLTAYPMMFFYYFFIVPLWILNSTSNAILRILRIAPVQGHGAHSEDEIKIILDQAQSTGMMSFRRLLYIENILDLGDLTAQNAMQGIGKTQSLHLDMTQEQIDGITAKYHYSRYPLLNKESGIPIGFIHIKDLYDASRTGKTGLKLHSHVRYGLKVTENQPLESLLPEMQQKGNHIAFVYDDQGEWTGIITLEDVLEEVVGTIEEEYPIEQNIRLISVLKSADQIVLDVEGTTIVSATNYALSKISPSILGMPLQVIMPHIAERERIVSTYVGQKLAIPHARFKALAKPVLIIARLKKPIQAPTPISSEKIHFLFVLLTPVSSPRMHQILLGHIARLFESEFLEARLEDATTSEELFEAISATEQATDMTI